MDIHRCRSVPYAPHAINALAFSQTIGKYYSSLRLAIGRDNGDIEIWNPSKGRWTHETTAWAGRGRTIQGLAWTRDDTPSSGYNGNARLFSVGDNNCVTEWNIATGQPKQSFTVNEVWCIAPSPPIRVNKKRKRDEDSKKTEETQDIACGCADGSIVLLSTANNELSFKKLITRPAKNKVRVLSMAWQDRNTLVTGNADGTIRVYDIQTRHNLRTMSLGNSGKGQPKDALVWCIDCLKNGNIVAGDSTGNLTFWDGKNYGQLQKIKAHEQDILCLVSSRDGRTIFSSGVDRRTSMYSLEISSSSTLVPRWIKMAQRATHDHDVRAMAKFENPKMDIVVTGGVDTRLVICPMHKFSTENHRRMHPVPQTSPLDGGYRRIVSWQDTELAVWEVGSYKRAQTIDLQVMSNFKAVAQVALASEDHICTVSHSSHGGFIAVGTVSELKLFSANRGIGGPFKITKIDVEPPIAQLGAKILLFSPDSKWLLVVTHDSQIYLLRTKIRHDGLGKWTCSFEETVKVKRRKLPSTQIAAIAPGYEDVINRAAFSSDSDYLAVSALDGNLYAFKLKDNTPPLTNGVTPLTNGVGHHSDSPSDSAYSSADEEMDEADDANASSGTSGSTWDALSELPPRNRHVLALSFRPGTHHLVTIDALHHLYEFDVDSALLTPWSARNPPSVFPHSFKLQRDRVIATFWDKKGRLWMYGPNWLSMIDTRRDLPIPMLRSPDSAIQDLTEENAQLRLTRRNNSYPKELAKLEKLKTTLNTSGAGSRVKQEDLRGVHRNSGTLSKERLEPNDEPEDDQKSEDGEDPVALLFTDTFAEEMERVKAEREELDSEEDPVARGVSVVDEADVPFWLTNRYQPILGIVVLGQPDPGMPEPNQPLQGFQWDDEEWPNTRRRVVKGIKGITNGVVNWLANVKQANKPEERDRMELVLVERPDWDLDLPPRYVGKPYQSR